MHLYTLRKAALECHHSQEEIISRARARFVDCLLRGDLSLGKGSTADVTADLQRMGFPALGKILERGRAAGEAGAGESSGVMGGLGARAGAAGAGMAGGSSSVDLTSTTAGAAHPAAPYSYLLSMPLQSLTADRFSSLQRAGREAQERYEEVRRRSEADMWMLDLDRLEKSLG